MKQLAKRLVDPKVIACLCVVVGFTVFISVIYTAVVSKTWILFLLFGSFFVIGRYLNHILGLTLSKSTNAISDSGVVPESEEANIDFETIPVAVMTLGADGSVLSANKAARELLKIKHGEALYFSELVEGMGRSMSQWISDASNRQGWQKSEFGMARRQEGDIYLRIQLGVIDTAESSQTTVVISDATELKSLEAQFVQSQKMQAIGQLAGGIAHDFNNLLTAISGYCDLLMLRHEKGDADFGDLVQINNNANRAAALVGQLLAYSRKQTLKPSALQVNETLSELTHLLNRLVGETITLDLQREKGLPLAFIDGRQLEQVLMNLVVNARDAMPDGGKISLRSKTMIYENDMRKSGAVILAGKYVSIEVEDEGVGIPKNLQAKIFEPFFSTKEVGEGTGLGLSMAYGIIKQTGGYIFADSDPGAGTLFTILLPVAENMKLSAPIQVAPESRRITGLKGARVLLVEDEDPVRAVSQRALQSQGVIL